METTVELTQIPVIFLASLPLSVLFLIALVVYHVKYRNLKDDAAHYKANCRNSEKEHLKSISLLGVKEQKIISLESNVKAASDNRDEWHNKYLDVRGELEEKLQMANIKFEHWQAKCEDTEDELERTRGVVQSVELQGKIYKEDYHALIAMPRRKRDKLIAELRKEMGVKVVKVGNEVEIVTDECLEYCLTVKNPTKKDKNDIFELAEKLLIPIINKSNAYPHIWYYDVGEQKGISTCIIGEGDKSRTYVTASEFMQRMRNHVGK